jgi:transcriptional regulatory protein GAL4
VKGATSSVVPLRALLGRERDKTQQEFSSTSWHSQSMFSNQFPTSLPFSNVSENTFVDAYFRYYHTTYPFLHEPLFRSQLQGKSPRPEGNSWTILYNAVLALGAWCIGDDDSVMDDFFYRKVARIPEESSIFESGNLAMVQALLLLSNYAQKRNRPNTGWNYLGLAVRMALSLGLHKEFPNWEITHLQREMRRRVWWGLFVFDSGASITFGRPVLLPEQGIMDASPVLNIHEEVTLGRCILSVADFF